MRCGKARENLLPFIQEKLGEAERNALLLHVAACAACRQELEGTRKLWIEMGNARNSVPTFDTEAGLSALRSRLEVEAGDGRSPFLDRFRVFRPAYLLPALGAAAVVIAVTAVYLQLPGADDGPDRVSQAESESPADGEAAMPEVDFVELLDGMELFEEFDVFQDHETVADLTEMDEDELDSILAEVDG